MTLTLSDGFKMNYETAPWGRPLNALFIHGNLASLDWWLPTFEALTTSGKSPIHGAGALIASDWRGYGKSTGLKSTGEIDFERFAQDYIELIEHLNLRDIHVVGHSTGGLIAMLAVLKRPELFKSLVLVDSVGAKGLELQLPLEQVLAHFDQMSKNYDYFSMVLAATIQGVDASYSQFQLILNTTWGCDKVAWVGVPERLATQIDFERRLPELRLPTLVMHGENDLVLPISGSEKLHRQIRSSRLEIVKSHGHSYNMEAPEAFARDLMSFWSRTGPQVFTY
jgi:pimeloyl-ACP methyl ester carboxylesterase